MDLADFGPSESQLIFGNIHDPLFACLLNHVTCRDPCRGSLIRPHILHPHHIIRLPRIKSMSRDRADEETSLLEPTAAGNSDLKSAIMSSETFWKIGASYGAVAVALGAFGAHGLKKHITDPARIANWNTAAHYQVRRNHAVEMKNPR